MRNEYPAKRVRLGRTEKGQFIYLLYLFIFLKGQFKMHIVKLLNMQSILQILSIVCMKKST